VSTTEHDTDASASASPQDDADATQQLRRPEAAARGEQEQSSSGGASGDARRKAASMRDGAMARVAPRRDLSSRRPAASRVPGAAAGAASAGSAAGASAARGRAQGGAAPGTRPPRPRRAVGPRRVRLTVQRVDPWSVFKIALLVSVALGIAGVVAVAVLWTVLSGMNVFQTLNEFIIQVTTGEDSAASFDLMDYVGFGRVVSLAVVFGVINVILLTALATLTAFLYNVCTALVGGLHLTLSDE
jgi:Transmembrane domain of unknown function (DUF3566)